MANSTTHAALPYPIKNARFSLAVPYLDADGDPTDPTTPDTEVSKDAGAFADCTEEVTTISGSNGVGYITLTGAETNCSLLALCAKVASGPKATLATIYPRALALIGSGTLSAGSAGGGTLGTVLAYDVTGCFIRTTGGTGGGGTGGASNQARKIATYTPSTGAFTVVPDWETTPSTDTTYDVLLPEGVTLGMLKTLNPATAGRQLVVDSAGLADANTVKVGPTGSGTAQTAGDIPARLPAALGANGNIKADLRDSIGVAVTSASGRPEVNTTHWGGTAVASAVILAAANIASDAFTAAKFAADAITSSKIADGALTAAKFASGAFDAVWTVATRTLTAISDSAGVTTLLARLTGTRAGYIDNLSAGAVATQASVDDLPTNAELATALAAADDATLAAIAALNIPSLSAIAAQIISDHGSGSYVRNTEPPTAAQNRAEMDSNSTKLANLDVVLSTRASQASVDDVPTNAELATALAAADDAALAVLALIDAKTTNLPSDPADQSLIIAATSALASAIAALNNLSAAQAQTAAAAALTAAGYSGARAAKLDALPVRLRKNTAFPNFHFFMVSDTDHLTGLTGLTVTAQRVLDAGAPAACANAPVEIASGLYRVNLEAADLNGDMVSLIFTAAGADARVLSAPLQEAA